MKTFTSHDIETVTKLPGGSVRYLANQLPVKRHGTRGRSRTWSLTDSVMVVLSAQFLELGYANNAAVSFVMAIRDEVQAIIDDPAAVRWMFAIPNADEAGSFIFTITDNSIDGLQMLEEFPLANKFSVHKMVGRALADLEAVQAGSSDG